jgi:hypothetical protein
MVDLHSEQDKHLERRRKKNSRFRDNGISVLVVMVLLQVQQPSTPVHTACLPFAGKAAPPPFSGGEAQQLGTPAGYLQKVCMGSCPLPFSGMLKAPHPLCCVSFSISSLFSVSFSFCRVKVTLSWSYARLSQGWLCEYRMLLICSPVGPCLPSRFGAGCIWRCGSSPVFSV